MHFKCLRASSNGTLSIHSFSMISEALVKVTSPLLLTCALIIASSTLAYAQAAQSTGSSASKSNDAAPKVNQQQAIAKAKQSVQGKVLKVDRNKEHYRVKMLNPKGRVISVNVNKQSGKVTPKSTEKAKPTQNKD